jgi:hypothetical protein
MTARGDGEFAGRDAFFELEFSPNVMLVATVRRFVGDFYIQILGDAEATSRLSVATHELLENAVRYSLDGYSRMRIGVTHESENVRCITINTSNRARDPHLTSIRAALDEMAEAASPDAHYQVLMRRSAKRKDGSGLGLGRVRAESEMEISYRIEGDIVHLRAQTRLTRVTP